jgi:ATP-dependent exoDNAse (exonuclease V) beta subunit
LKTENFKVFRSSAGSGKTYRLAFEYLKLALKDPGYYRRILAVTFTNKATNEMKARIIKFLFDIANNEAEEELIEKLGGELEIDRYQLYDRARITLIRILHGYSYFSVSTIDSFFQRIINAFSRDLGIHGGYHLEFDIGHVQEEVIDSLFIDLDDDAALKKWLVQFAMSKIESNRSWDIRYDIRQLAGQLFFESFSTYYDAIGERIRDTRQLTDVLRNIRKERDRFKDKFEKLGRQGLDNIQEYGLELTDFSRGITGPAGLFYKLAGNQKVNVSNTYLNDALYSVDAWFTKKSKKQDTITKVLHDGLLDLFEKTFKLYKDDIIKDNTYHEAQKYYYNLGILSNLMKGLKKYREDNEVVLISDLSHLLRVVIGENDAPFIYEKVGSFYNHFLIDEFQDTSRFQWANFLPLVMNSLSAGMFNMVVGDVKQSIYRWRGGDWEILQNQVDTDVGQYHVDHEPLSKNWRSLENIVLFNNTLFQILPALLKEKFVGDINELYETGLQPMIMPYSNRFEDAYRDIRQDLPGSKTYKHKGLVEIKFLKTEAEETDGLDWRDKVLHEIVIRIKALQDQHYSLNDIAILVRTKEEGRKIANHLLDYKKNKETDPKYHFDVISSESLYLKASPAINVIINFIRLVINHNDLIATANFYYWVAVLKDNDSKIDYGDVFRKISDPDAQIRLNTTYLAINDYLNFEKYRSVPLIDLIEEISLLFHLSGHKEEGAYILGLQNVILEYLENNNNDLHSFIEWWSDEGENKSIKPSMTQDAINILTIHQSKGLQYKIVLIPFCSWDIDHSPNNDNIIWASSTLKVLDQIPYYPLRYSKKLGESFFSSDYFNEKSMAYMDNLNLLYVALTRAEEGLLVFSELPRKLDRDKTIGDILLKFFNCGHTGLGENNAFEYSGLMSYWNAEAHVFIFGQSVEQSYRDRNESMYFLDDYTRGRWQNKIAIRKQADILSHEGSEVPGVNINYGILLHDILSKIYRKEQTPAVLTAEEHSGNITAKERQELTIMLEDFWKIDIVNDWFTGDWEIKTEVPVLPDKGNLKRLDRVMIRENKAIVVDYKTGTKRHSDINQVKNYMGILREMGYGPVDGYILYLTNRELIEV